jgi:uncharacterized membrane protein
MNLFKKKSINILSDAEKEQLVAAIKNAESRTSGEIRVYMEEKCKNADPLERAAKIFFKLKMNQTAERNAVLLYIAVKDRHFAIFGDEGIYKKTGKEYWENLVNNIFSHFNYGNFAEGISRYIHEIGEGLHQHFPYNRETDQNELPDEIVFGRN